MMKKTALYILCFILAAVFSIAAQTTTKTVTNADLEKYRQQRVQADKDYLENYQRRGLPSPEEIDKRLDESRAKLDDLSTKLRAERLESERIEAERLYNEQMQAQTAYPQSQVVQPGYDGFGFYWSYGPRGWHRFYRPRPQVQQPGYFAGGQFWPTPVDRQRNRPAAVWLKPKN